MSHLVPWVLGIELEASAGVVWSLNHQAISPALSFVHEAELGRFRGLPWLWFVSGPILRLPSLPKSPAAEFESSCLLIHPSSGHSFSPTPIHMGSHENNFSGVLAKPCSLLTDPLCHLWLEANHLFKNFCSNLKPQRTAEKSRIWQLLNG